MCPFFLLVCVCVFCMSMCECRYKQRRHYSKKADKKKA